MREFQTLQTVTDAGILLVTINRPAARNALDQLAQRELRELLRTASDDDEVRGLVITGAGDAAFVSGADIGELRDRDLLSGLRGDAQQLFSEVQAFEKPTVAAINGHALGGGCELALACDLRIAVEHAKIGLPEVGLGIIPGAGGTQRLARHIGVGRAVDMILTGRLLSADEARDAGLVSDVVPRDRLLARSTEIMRGILSKAPLAVRLAKLVTRSALDVDERTGLMIERLAQALLYTTDDKREGTTAFMERRKPGFSGR
ncbi:enoyl-CoA hydratase/isomerase family protein [Ruicaihuangia caeni]|uniref:enoyl-CoA hydratase n=1 Tax=Ruicaihuangia caeni TaxID=3042517 RepID=A0AAW6T7M9_9MICO|nr:enoyl-CoA hydratase-related protein [Klugiella sp. YN-L-19]MDI2098711.1 enoyl-CoA hydratase-related protein [Klugiella sp. YN-L-19]